MPNFGIKSLTRPRTEPKFVGCGVSLKSISQQGHYLMFSDGYGSKIFYPGWIKFFCSGQAGSGQQSLVWVWHWKIYLEIPNFSILCPLGPQKNIFGLGQKVPRSKTGWPLLYFGSGRVRAHLYMYKTRDFLLHGFGSLLLKSVFILSEARDLLSIQF